MTDRARELVERLREEARTIQSVSSIMVDPRATLLCKAADFIEQSLMPPEGDTLSDEVVERVARAIYDAPDSQSGDAVGDVIWASEHLFYEREDDEEIVDLARRVTMGVCRDAARAAIAAMPRVSPQAGMREALEHIKFGMDFAYEKGLHEFGYDPIETIRAALSTAPIPMSEGDALRSEPSVGTRG